jgi:cyanophycin synthetase
MTMSQTTPVDYLNQTDRTATIALLKDALAKLGYTCETLALGAQLQARFTAPSGTSWLTSVSRISYPFVSDTARPISKDKYLAYNLAELLDVSIPKTLRVDDDTSESEIADMLAYAPLVVKPNSASLSKGLTLNIRNNESLQTAIRHAKSFSDKVLVQQQVQGEEVRIVILDGKADAAILRQSARLIGDGISTVSRLLEKENETRKGLGMPYLVYPQLAAPLIDLSEDELATVPAIGKVIELNQSTMIRGGASMYNILNDIHPSYLETAEKLGSYIGKGFVVVDMFIQDYHAPQTPNNYTFIEFNMSPVLKLFYSCRDGRHYDILPKLAGMIDQVLQPKKRSES